jgi:hypothetical protein
MLDSYYVQSLALEPGDGKNAYSLFTIQTTTT